MNPRLLQMNVKMFKWLCVNATTVSQTVLGSIDPVFKKVEKLQKSIIK